MYGLVVWANTYSLNMNPLFMLQKRAIRNVTFSNVFFPLSFLQMYTESIFNRKSDSIYNWEDL